MKIAIPTNDRLTLAERSGRASLFAIIEVENQKIMSIEYLENNHEKTHHHGDHQEGEGEHGHGDMVALLKGVDVLLGRKFGPHFSRDFHQAGVKLKITAIENIEEAVLAFIKEKI